MFRALGFLDRGFREFGGFTASGVRNLAGV